MVYITFKKLTRQDIPLLLKWLWTPHVKTWWDPDTVWTKEIATEKYSGYCDGYKLQNGVSKPIHAFLILVDDIPCGYIQYYNAYDFPRIPALQDLPESLGAFDMYIGEPEFLGKGIGSAALIKFLGTMPCVTHEYIFADPHSDNPAAIKCYQKAGFMITKEFSAHQTIWMIRQVIDRTHQE